MICCFDSLDRNLHVVTVLNKSAHLRERRLWSYDRHVNDKYDGVSGNKQDNDSIKLTGWCLGDLKGRSTIF